MLSNFKILKDSDFNFHSWIIQLGFTKMENNPATEPYQCYKLDLSSHMVLYIPVFGNSIDLITDFKPSFEADERFYAVYDFNFLQGKGDILFLWTTCFIPQNQEFAEQLFIHCLSDPKPFEKNQIFQKIPFLIDESFVFNAWLVNSGFEEIQKNHLFEIVIDENLKIKVEYQDPDRIEVSRITPSESVLLIYGHPPLNQKYAEQLIAHCMVEATPKKSKSIIFLLEEINQLYKEKAPVVFERVIQPATESDLLAFENELGEPLPPDFREFLQHNIIQHNFIGNYSCLSLPSILKEWHRMNKLLEEGVFEDGRVERVRQNFGSHRFQNTWWSKKWIPFCEDSCANKRCIDFEPTGDGIKYQLLDIEIQDGMGPFLSNFHTFREFLQKHLEYLIKNQFTVEDWGIEINV